MIKKIKVKTFAKLNLTLEVVSKRNDGFHNICSLMQNINLFDILSLKVENFNKNVIILNGNSNEIPYDSNNLVYKAAEMFLEKTKIENKKVEVYIEKNIPVSAGLAGGSSNAVGVLVALNKLFDNVLQKDSLEDIFSSLGSDLNFCFTGGTCVCTSRGEIVEKINTPKGFFSVIKPKNLPISAKFAYQEFAKQNIFAQGEKTFKLAQIIQNENRFEPSFFFNSLQAALEDSFLQLREIKIKLPESFMTGSGSSYFVFDKNIDKKLFNSNDFFIVNALETVDRGFELFSEFVG